MIRRMSQGECKIATIGQDNFETNADVSIETRSSYRTDCDVRVSSFKGLQELFFYTSRLLQETYDQILIFTMNRNLVVGVLWLILTIAQGPEIFVSATQILFYHLPFYLCGVLNIVIDKGSLPYLTNFFHPVNSEKIETNHIKTSIIFKNNVDAMMMFSHSDQLISNQSQQATLMETNIQYKNSQDQRILTSSLQFRSSQVILSQTLILKKFFLSCLLSSAIEAIIIIELMIAFLPLESEDGMELPVITMIKFMFILVNWIGQVRLMLSVHKFSWRQALFTTILLTVFSIIYLVSDISDASIDSDTTSFQAKLWKNPQIWLLFFTMIGVQSFVIVMIQYLEIQFFVHCDLIRVISKKEIEKILLFATQLRLMLVRRVERHSFNLMMFIKKLFAKVDMDITIQQLLNPENSHVNNTKIHKYKLSFLSNDAQKLFQEEIYPRSLELSKRGVLISIVTQIIFIADNYNILLDLISPTSDPPSSLTFTRICIGGYIFFLILMLLCQGYFIGVFHETKNSHSYGLFTKVFFCLNSLLLLMILLICIDTEFIQLFTMLLLANIHFQKAPFHIVGLANLLIVFVNSVLVVSSSLKISSYFRALMQPLIIIAYFIEVIFQKYNFERRQMQNFIQQYELNIQNQKINDVLEILLPKFIINRIKSNDPTKPFRFQEKQGNASIIFCDIVHFDDIIKEKNEKIIPFLDKVFKCFDKFCSRSGLQKIETVGKTYMASAGLKDFEDQVDPREREVDPVERAANLALDMIEYVKDLKWSTHGHNLQLKIGIHYGQVIAGVIGHHKPQFSLIGDTVNTTSRVCSKGNASEITISEEAYERIKDRSKFYFSEPKVVNAKGKGDILLYTLKKFNPSFHKSRATFLKIIRR